MELNIQPKASLIIIAGNYGSGKTEVCVNFAKHLRKLGVDNIKLVDLDIVNPYFRSREAREDLEKNGIKVLSPKGDKHYGELPIISPQIKAEIISGHSMLILDVGGDDVGARVLSSLFDAILGKKYEFLVVLNTNRPFTEDVSGCLKMIESLEKSSRLEMTGIVSNTHMIDETTLETIKNGLKVIENVAEKRKIPIRFVSVNSEILNEVKEDEFNYPVLPISRLMLKPWEVKPGVN